MQDEQITRRRFIATGASAGALIALGGLKAHSAQSAASQGATAKPKGRVVILGFDGVDPRILDHMMDAGEAPNFKRLRDSGAFKTLRSTIPPQSPVAWTSFATCKNPGGHGIYDLFRRRPSTYLLDVGTGNTAPHFIRESGVVIHGPRSIGYRKGTPFWVVADKQGLRCKILNIPFAYPADPLEHGIMHCGLGTPDLRGYTSIFFAFSDTFDAKQSVAGGMRIPLRFEGNTATVSLEGAKYGVNRKRSTNYTETPLTIAVDRQSRSAVIEAQGTPIKLAENEWSQWVEWRFPITPDVVVYAISRFYLLEAGEHVNLYMSCLQFDPRKPYVPFSHPADYTAKLFDRYGLYKTIGWIFDTHALRQDFLSEDVFLADVRQTMEWRAQLTLDEIDRGEFDLLASAWTATDRVGHLFWRFRDPEHPLYTSEGAEKYGKALEETYRKADEIVGRTMEKLDENDLFMVLSDHGFETFRTGFNLNTWLVRNGYLAIKNQDDPATAYSEKPWLLGFDWRRTKAYAFGLSPLYLNLQGRESQGIVRPDEADGLIAELKGKLLEVIDPETGNKVFSNIYTKHDYHGEAMADAPDISLGYSEAYQNSKKTVAGTAPKDLFEPTLDKWSGEHAASDVARLPGILFSSRPIAVKEPAIIDLGVTTLKYLGAEAPSDFEGKSLV